MLIPHRSRRQRPALNKKYALIAFVGALSILGGTTTILLKTLTPSAYAYPYDLSPAGQVRESITAEISSAQARSLQNPTDGLPLADLADAYLKMARITGSEEWYSQAEATALQSLENLPFNNDGAILTLAKLAEAEHDFAEAARLAEQASGGKALAILVTSKLAVGDVAEANTIAEELVDFSPSMGSLTLRSLARHANGDRTGAIQDLQQAIAVEQPGEVRGSALARTLLGQRHAEQADLGTARRLYQEALAIVPGYPQALLDLAELESQQGNYRKAERLYAQVDDPLVLLGLARVKAAQGKAAEAQAQWAEAEVILREKVNENPLDHGRELATLLLERGNEDDIAEALALMEAEVQNRRDAETIAVLDWARTEASQQ